MKKNFLILSISLLLGFVCAGWASAATLSSDRNSETELYLALKALLEKLEACR